MIAITNDRKTPRKVANRTIMPGATAYFDKRELPPHLHPSAKKDVVEQVNPLTTLLDDTIKNIIPQLPGLSHDQLTELEEIEANYAKRSGVAKAIQEERLRRADLELNDAENNGDDDNLADVLTLDAVTMATEIKALSDAQLHELFAHEQAGQNRDDVLTTIQGEVELRAAGDGRGTE
jgi:hypothetical protein